MREDFKPDNAKHGALMKQLLAALSLADDAEKQAAVEKLRPDLEAMLSDKSTLEKVLAGSATEKLLAGIMGRDIANAMAVQSNTRAPLHATYPNHPGRKGGGSLPRGASPAHIQEKRG